MAETPPQVVPGAAGDAKRLLIVLAVILAGWCIFLYSFAPRKESVTGTTRADFGLRLKTLDGQPIDLATQRGRTIFLNFWATWCGPCRMEMPSIARLAANPKMKDVVFYVASIEDDAPGVRRYAERENLKLPFVIVDGSIPSAYKTNAIPATYVIAPDGRIAIAEIGAAEWDDPATVERIAALKKSDSSTSP
jgi:thiol-disulfide isomerase/thioredoxin